MSSTSEYEGFGLTIAEGMACGLAVVAMSVGGIPDLVVDGETGFLVPSGDVDAFAERLSELDADRPRLRALGRGGRARAVELFSLDALAENFTRLYEELAGRRSTPGRSGG
jgi:glycosyltransferase involved in cell wall biosynthesis